LPARKRSMQRLGEPNGQHNSREENLKCAQSHN
jgi:hypothetical protein